VLYYPLFAAAVAAAGGNADRGRIAAALLDADLGRLKFPRAQLEKAVLLLAAQQRLAQPARRRGRGGSPTSRPWFAEALTLFEITQADTPQGRAALRRLRAQQHRPGEERRPAVRPQETGVAEATAIEELPAPAAAGGESAAEGAPGEKRRRRRRGRGRGRETARDAEATGPAVVEADQVRSASRRSIPPDDADAVIDPDAAFGDSETDLEPPGGGPPDSRTD